MNILSLFDGMGCGMIAAERAGIKVGKYYASEIDKYATKVSEANYPDIVRLGDVTKWEDWSIDWSSIDLVTGGFPCQAWSMAGKQLGDKDERGKLFWVMLDVMKMVRKHNPSAHFLIENVKMKKEFEQYITHHTEEALREVNKILINSSLVSAQNRNRYYWTSWVCEQPKDKGIALCDVLEDGELEPNSEGWHRWWREKSGYQLGKKYSAICNDGSTDKAITMTARQYASWNGNFVIIQRPRGNNSGGVGAKDGKTPTLSSNSWEHNNHLTDRVRYRKLTPIECERLQTVPDNYTNYVSDSQRYKMLGNGWTVDVIAHILSLMPR